ncbi:GNAT family protein [Alkalihalophilus pseudofirmus]|nr:GNAT family protein [Alkalihalophilus pseudofirmus]WEG19067.1 GNAT family protein [Alkalihalophilus pseudofirmus]
MIETSRLRLLPVALEHADRIEELASDYELAKTTSNVPHPYPKGGAKDFIKMVGEKEKKGEIILLSVIEKSSTQLIGLINININLTHNRGELGYWIGVPYWGKGYGTEAAKALLTYGFEETGLNRIYAAAYTVNPASWKVMEKIGLEREGVLKQHLARAGTYYDVVYYGMTRDEYFERS